MPYGFGTTSVFTSSAGGDIGGGRYYTRFRGPLLVGQANDMAGGTVGTPNAAPHVANISTQPSDFLLVAPGQFISTAVTVGLVYVSQTTATLVPGVAPTPGITGMAAV